MIFVTTALFFISEWFVMDFVVTWELFGLLFSMALLAGFIDSIAGGGGLVTIPVLLTVGLPPVQALATNKLQSIGGSFSATLYFTRKGWINWHKNFPAIIATFVGSVCGTLFVQVIDTNLLKQIIPFLLIGVAVFFILNPKPKNQMTTAHISMTSFAMSAAIFIGFYDGMLGPGTGSFFAIAFVLLLGQNLAIATAHAKQLNFISNLASLIFFAGAGKVLWHIGLIMLVGQFIGAQVGARMVFYKGSKLIRPMIIIVSLVLTFKLLFDNYANILFS